MLDLAAIQDALREFGVDVVRRNAKWKRKPRAQSALLRWLCFTGLPVLLSGSRYLHGFVTGLLQGNVHLVFRSLNWCAYL